MPEIYFYVLYDFFFFVCCLYYFKSQSYLIFRCSAQLHSVFILDELAKRKKNKKIKIIHTSITKTCLYILTKNKEENMRQNDQ